MMPTKEDWENFHVKNVHRKIMELEERRKEGMRYCELPIEQVQLLLSENIELHLRLKQIEQHLGVMAMAANPLMFIPGKDKGKDGK
jgi:hypothetical protein